MHSYACSPAGGVAGDMKGAKGIKLYMKQVRF